MAGKPILFYAYFAGMIKLGIFGDHTTNPELIERIQTLTDIQVVGGYYSGFAELPATLREYYGPIDLMECADALLILSEKSASIDLIKLMLRKSKHLFLKAIPYTTTKDIKELAGLEKEAGIVSSVYSSFSYIHFFKLDQINYERPVLVNLRTCFTPNSINNSDELLFLLTALNHLMASSYRKIEVFGLNKSENHLVLNLRIEYNNGSVVNLTLSNQKSEGFFELFHSGTCHQFRFSDSLFSSFYTSNQEFMAISDFLNCIQTQDRSEISFDKLIVSVQMLNQIQENLHFIGVDF